MQKQFAVNPYPFPTTSVFEILPLPVLARREHRAVATIDGAPGDGPEYLDAHGHVVSVDGTGEDWHAE